jgi:hypothetical protein
MNWLGFAPCYFSLPPTASLLFGGYMAVDEKNAPLPSSDHLPRKRIVVFVDILGFSEKIDQMPTNPDLYLRMRDLQETIQQIVENHYRKGQPSKLFECEDPQKVQQMAHFSDSIVVSFPLYDSNLLLPAALAIQFAQELTIKLLASGVFIRGGIASGWTYHEQNMLFGAGMIAAYKLENRVAHVPRILVAEEVVGFLSGDPYCMQFLGQDSDGCWFVKPFSWFLGGRPPQKMQQEMQKDSSFRDTVVEQFKCARAHIQKELARAKDKGPDLLAKYRWLENQLNVAEKEIFQGMNISVDKIEVPWKP